MKPTYSIVMRFFKYLDISYLEYSGSGRVGLKAFVDPLWTFASPIQQIAASHPIDDGERQRIGMEFDIISFSSHIMFPETMLAVRTYASTSFLEVKAPRSNSKTHVHMKEIMSISRSDVGDRHIIDMVLPASRRTLGLVVNHVGEVYRCSAPYGSKST